MSLEAPPHADRVLVAASPRRPRPRLLLATDEPVPAARRARRAWCSRIPAEVAVLAVDALDASGEPIGRLARPGVSELRFDGASVSGRLGATHGMGAGIGGGRWTPGLAEAAFEAGYEAWLPTWMPDGLERGPPAGGAGHRLPGGAAGDRHRVDRRRRRPGAAAPGAGAAGQPRDGRPRARRERIGDVEGVLRGPAW